MWKRQSKWPFADDMLANTSLNAKKESVATWVRDTIWASTDAHHIETLISPCGTDL